MKRWEFNGNLVASFRLIPLCETSIIRHLRTRPLEDALFWTHVKVFRTSAYEPAPEERNSYVRPSRNGGATLFLRPRILRQKNRKKIILAQNRASARRPFQNAAFCSILLNTKKNFVMFWNRVSFYLFMRKTLESMTRYVSKCKCDLRRVHP